MNTFKKHFHMSLVVLCMLSGVGFALSQVQVLQRGYDQAQSGSNLQETILNTSNVNSNRFGRLFSYPVLGQVHAQPLYVPGVSIPGQGIHNVLYVATMYNRLYAFDADSNSGTNAGLLWSVNFNTTSAFAYPETLVLQMVDAGLIHPSGIEGTPVIDTSSNSIYLVVHTVENGGSIYRLHGISLTDGSEIPGSPIIIQGTFAAPGSATITFNPSVEQQRASLALAKGQVIIEFCSHADSYWYYGWVFAYDERTLANTGTFVTVPGDGTYPGRGGIWMSSRAPAVDQSGYVYLQLGNGSFNGQLPNGIDFDESFVKLDPGNKLSVQSSFTPPNWLYLDQQDEDLGSSGPLLIPGTTAVAGGGKEGVLYILDSTTAPMKLLQSETITNGGGIKGGPVFWNRSQANGGPLLYNYSDSDVLKAFSFNPSTETISSSPVAQGTIKTFGPGGFLVLSASGSTPGTAIVWAIAGSVDVNPFGPSSGGGGPENLDQPGVLRAFDATTLTELWDSLRNPDADDYGIFSKFSVPIVANGKVYVPTISNQVVVYGLLPITPSFTVRAQPAYNFALNNRATNTLHVTPLNGFSSPVVWSAVDLPQGILASFTSSSEWDTVLTITVGTGITRGHYRLTLSARGGTSTQIQELELFVADAVTIPQSTLKVVGADSNLQHAVKVIDGNPGTVWVSAQYPPESDRYYSQYLILDLGKTYHVSGLSYLPRQDLSCKGTIANYEVSVSLDGISWGPHVAYWAFDYRPSDSCPSNTTSPVVQQIAFPVTPGRYVRFKSWRSVANDGYASVAELNVYSTQLTYNDPETFAIAASDQYSQTRYKIYQAGQWSLWSPPIAPYLLPLVWVSVPYQRTDFFSIGPTQNSVQAAAELASGLDCWIVSPAQQSTNVGNQDCWTYSTQTSNSFVMGLAAIGSAANGYIVFSVNNANVPEFSTLTNDPHTQKRVWSSWIPLNQNAPSAAVSSAPSAVLWSDGHSDAFFCGQTPDVWQISLSASLVQGNWQDLGLACKKGAAITAVLPAAGASAYLFAVAADSSFWTTTFTNESVGRWTKLNTPSGRQIVSNQNPAVIAPDGTLSVFVRDSTGSLWSETLTNHVWSGWTEVGAGGVITTDPIVTIDQTGRIDVFARGSDNVTWWQITKVNGVWTAWQVAN
jgi:hypothetical protein